VPYPIQSGSITERLRKFFRIRGRTGFQLDEMVAPVVMVQDLTKGPYQSGVTPAAGQIRNTVALSQAWAFAVVLNDKLGSLTPVLGSQFEGRSFSFTWAEILNVDVATPGTELSDLRLVLASRAAVAQAGVPKASAQFASIQNNDGTGHVPVEIFTYDVTISGETIWRGLLGDNTNVAGSRRTFDSIEPSITIGPEDALIFTSPLNIGIADGTLQVAYRGFYQEQPA